MISAVDCNTHKCEMWAAEPSVTALTKDGEAGCVVTAAQHDGHSCVCCRLHYRNFQSRCPFGRVSALTETCYAVEE